MEGIDKAKSHGCIPRYELGTDSVNTRRSYAHSRVLTRRYNPSWTPTDTLAVDIPTHMTSPARLRKKVNLETAPSGEGLTRTTVEDMTRANKRQKVMTQSQSTKSAMAPATHITSTLAPARPLRSSADRSRKDLFSCTTPAFVNSEYHSVDNMMRTKSNLQLYSSEFNGNRFPTISTSEQQPAIISSKKQCEDIEAENLSLCTNDHKGKDDSISNLVNLSSRRMSNPGACRSFSKAQTHRVTSRQGVGQERQEKSVSSTKKGVPRLRCSKSVKSTRALRSNWPRSNQSSHHNLAVNQEQSHSESGMPPARQYLRNRFSRDETHVEHDEASIDSDELHISTNKTSPNPSTPVIESPPRARHKLVHMLRKEETSAKKGLARRHDSGAAVEGDLSTPHCCSWSKDASIGSRYGDQPTYTFNAFFTDLKSSRSATPITCSIIIGKGQDHLHIQPSNKQFHDSILELSNYLGAAVDKDHCEIRLFTQYSRGQDIQEILIRFLSTNDLNLFAKSINHALIKDHVSGAELSSLSHSHFHEAVDNSPSFNEKVPLNGEIELLKRRTASRPARQGYQTRSLNSHCCEQPSITDDEPGDSLPQTSIGTKAIQNPAHNSGLDIIPFSGAGCPWGQTPHTLDAAAKSDELLATRSGNTVYKPWKCPLLFPPEDPGKAVVEFGDLRRLDPGEFLNDSLLTFGLKYYEDRYRLATKDPKKTYIFNTFFFEKLCASKTTKAGINYDGVKRWTSKVDIFDFDYIIVPINESAHWYGALICNLPNVIANADVREHLGCYKTNRVGDNATQSQTPPLKVQPNYRDGTISYDGNRLNDIGATTGRVDNNVDEDEAHSSLLRRQIKLETTAQGSILHHAKSKRSFGRSTNGPDGPTIIMFDSFGESHPATARKLNQYLQEESRAKLDFELDALPCINAKGIPLQSNAFDCGVYLLGYLEKFFDDPLEFVTKAVTRSFNMKTDFAGLDAPQIRQNIRAILHSKYEEQKAVARKKTKV